MKAANEGHSDSDSEWSVTVDQVGDLGIDELVLSSEPVTSVDGVFCGARGGQEG